jgi:MFS family permease
VAALASVPLVRRIMSDAPAVPTSGPTTATADPDGVAQRPPLPAGFFWFPVGAFFFVAGVQAQLSWVVPYLSESVGLEEGVAGVVVTVATGTGILGALVLLRRGDPDASRRLVKVVGLCASAAGFTVLIALGDVLGPTSVALGLAASTAVSLAAVGAMQAAVVAAAADAVGRSTGVTLTGYFLGSLVAPTAFGLLVDAVGGYGWAWIATALSYAFAAVAFQQARRIPVHPVGPAIAA